MHLSQDRKSQEWTVNVVVAKGPNFRPNLFPLYISDVSDKLMCNISVNAKETALSSKHDQVFSLWQ